MLSPIHLLLIVGVLVLLFAPGKLPKLGRGIRSGIDGFKKGLKGEEDIDVTDSIKRLDDDGKS